MKKMLVASFLFFLSIVNAASEEIVVNSEHIAFFLQLSVDGLQRQIDYYQSQMQAKDTTLEGKKYFFEQMIFFESLKQTLEQRIWVKRIDQ